MKHQTKSSAWYAQTFMFLSHAVTSQHCWSRSACFLVFDMNCDFFHICSRAGGDTKKKKEKKKSETQNKNKHTRTHVNSDGVSR